MMNHSPLCERLTVVPQVGAYWLAKTEPIATREWFGRTTLLDPHSLLSPVHADSLCTR